MGKGDRDGAADNAQDLLGDGMGKGTRDGMADNTQDPPLGASTDTACDEGIDDEGDE